MGNYSEHWEKEETKAKEREKIIKGVGINIREKAVKGVRINIRERAIKVDGTNTQERAINLNHPLNYPAKAKAKGNNETHFLESATTVEEKDTRHYYAQNSAKDLPAIAAYEESGGTRQQCVSKAKAKVSIPLNPEVNKTLQLKKTNQLGQ